MGVFFLLADRECTCALWSIMKLAGAIENGKNVIVTWSLPKIVVFSIIVEPPDSTSLTYQ